MEEQDKKLYVGNLEFSVTEEDLGKFVEEKGIKAKSVKVIQDKYSGRSKGFGFIEMDSDDETQKAIEALDGQDLKGRALRVSKARKPKPRMDGDRPPRRF